MYYFGIILIRSTCTLMWPNYPVTMGEEKMGTAFKLRQRMKNFCHVSRFAQNLVFGHYTLLFGRVRQRNVPKIITCVQGLCFCLKSPLFCNVFFVVVALLKLPIYIGHARSRAPPSTCTTCVVFAAFFRTFT